MKVVLGGGLGGLSAAYYLGKKGCQVCLVERSKRLGGWVRTVKDPTTGVCLEVGPHTVRPVGEAGRNTLSLVAELGIKDDIYPIKRSDPAATKRMICVNSQLHPLPSSFFSMFKTLRPFSKPLVLAFVKDLLTPMKISTDETAYDFIERRFGRDLAEYAISPMLCGICAGDAKEISIKSLMPMVYNAEQNHGSVIRGIVIDSFTSPKIPPSKDFPDIKTWSVWTHKNGLSCLIDSLHNRVKQQSCTVKLSSKINNLNISERSVTCDIDGKQHEFSHAVSSLPSHSLAPLLYQQHPALSDLLTQIPFATVIVVNLVFEGNVLKDKAFGFLVPPSENKSLLGIIYDSCILPQEKYTVFTAMLGGRWFNKYFSPSTTEDEIKQLTLSYFKSILGICDNPVTCNISILKDCIPQYTLGHTDRVSNIHDYIKKHRLPLSLVGASYNGIGVNDVIMTSKKAVELIQ